MNPAAAPIPAAALSSLSEELYGRIQNFVRRRVRNPEDAQEITQEVFLRLAATPADQAPSQPTAWLFQVARNAVTDFYRKRAIQPQELTAWERSLRSDVNEVFLMAECLQPIIERLPPAERDVMRHTELVGKSIVSFARSSGVAYSTLKSRVQRARLRIKEMLVACCQACCERC